MVLNTEAINYVLRIADLCHYLVSSEYRCIYFELMSRNLCCISTSMLKKFLYIIICISDNRKQEFHTEERNDHVQKILSFSPGMSYFPK